LHQEGSDGEETKRDKSKIAWTPTRRSSGSASERPGAVQAAKEIGHVGGEVTKRRKKRRRGVSQSASLARKKGK
jgi:hypothetical protein